MSLHELRARLLRWLLEDALPLWEMHGVDRDFGGYFETLRYNSIAECFEAHGEVRRGRVVARQMFAFDAGVRLGWKAAHTDPVLHGNRFLLTYLHRADGMFHTAYDAVSRTPHGAFSLYECAFYLFALARTCMQGTARQAREQMAVTCLVRLREGWSSASGGFEESRPHSLPLKSNPHMHLFEAALEWLAVATDATPWAQLAAEVAELCLTKFIDLKTGALREFFDGAWNPAASDAGRIIEPGHQFEWAWLLLRWSADSRCQPPQAFACQTAAARLIAIGERRGVDPGRGVVMNELWDDMTSRDRAGKIWPQTERVKAWCAVLAAAPPAEDAAPRATLEIAGAVLLRYLETGTPGLWHETQQPDGSFRDETCKASSFYHIVFAIETLDLTLARLASVVS